MARIDRNPEVQQALHDRYKTAGCGVRERASTVVCPVVEEKVCHVGVVEGAGKLEWRMTRDGGVPVDVGSGGEDDADCGGVAAVDCVLQGGCAMGCCGRVIDWRTEVDDGGDERWGAVQGRVVEWPYGRVDTQFVSDAEGGVGRTEQGAQTGGEVVDDAEIEMVLSGAAVEDGREELVVAGVGAREYAEITRWEDVSDGQDEFIGDGGDGHGDGHGGGEDLAMQDSIHMAEFNP